MTGEARDAQRPASRRRIAWIVAAALLAVLVLALVMALQAERVARLALGQAGDALGLEITAEGVAEYHLRDTPTLVVREVTARAPGAATPVLVADRMLLSLPWATLRGRLRDLDFTRIELDAPVLDLAALQAWLATRPPGEGRFLTLQEGLAVEDGTVVAEGWRVEEFDLHVPSLHEDRPVTAHASGRYAAGTTTLPFDLHAVMQRPASGSALGVAGVATVVRDQWRIPARVRLQGTWQSGDAGWGIARMVLGAMARYESGDTRARFALGLAAPLRHVAGRTTLAPMHVSVLPVGRLDTNPIPPLRGAGMLAHGEALELRLAGTIPRWPAAWPALPAPLDAASAPTGFDLRYEGPVALDTTASLALEREGARADTRLRLPDVTAWLDEQGSGSPLPPIDGTASIPRMEVAGATLHGIELVFDDPAVDDGDGEPDADE